MRIVRPLDLVHVAAILLVLSALPADVAWWARAVLGAVAAYLTVKGLGL